MYPLFNAMRFKFIRQTNGRSFHHLDAQTEKARSLNVTVFDLGNFNKFWLEDFWRRFGRYLSSRSLM